jgi:protein-tyrosine kinase
VARSRGIPDPATDRILLVTSARPGDGKSFIAINLALAIAYEKDARVLLLDADAYRQSLLSYLGISADTGWLDIVSSPDCAVGDHIHQTNVANLAVLAAGKQRAEIPELMSSTHMATLLRELVRDDPKRYIIIDSLPCLTSTEPSILAALAGQTLFVVAAHQTTRDEIDSSLRLLNMSPTVNLILNRAEPTLTEQFRDYGYAHRYER